MSETKLPKHLWRGRDGRSASRISLDPDSLCLDRESIEQNEWTRTLAVSMDALVRSSRNATEVTLGPLSERFRTHWMEKPEVWMEFTADGVSVLEDGYLDERSWVLATFIAGVRRMRPTDHLGDLDCLRLAAELAVLRPTAASVEAFRDWLWADGAEGFEVEMRSGFAEVLDTILANQKLELRAVSLRDDAGAAMEAEPARIVSRELDAAAVREEFEVPLATYSRTLRESHAERISSDSAAAARKLFEDVTSWATAEFDVAMNIPFLRNAIPPRRLARQLVSRLSTATDRRLLRYVANLMVSEDEFAKLVTLHLEAQGLGRALAKGTQIHDPDTRDTLIRFMQVSSDETASSMADHLLRRAGGDDSAAPHVAGIIRRYDAAKFFGRLDASQLDESSGALLMDTLLAAEVPPGLLRRALLAAPARVAISWLDDQSDELFWSLEGVVRELLRGDSRLAIEHLVESIVQRSEKQAAKLLAEILDGGAGVHWSRRALSRASSLVVRAGLGERYAMRWVGEQSTPLALRVVTIRALSEEPLLLQQLVRRRFTEFMDPPEVKEALKEARMRAKGSSLSTRPPMAKTHHDPGARSSNDGEMDR